MIFFTAIKFIINIILLFLIFKLNRKRSKILFLLLLIIINGFFVDFYKTDLTQINVYPIENIEIIDENTFRIEWEEKEEKVDINNPKVNFGTHHSSGEVREDGFSIRMKVFFYLREMFDWEVTKETYNYFYINDFYTE